MGIMGWLWPNGLSFHLFTANAKRANLVGHLGLW